MMDEKQIQSWKNKQKEEDEPAVASLPDTSPVSLGTSPSFEEMDLARLLRRLWCERRFFFKIGLVAAMVGLVVVFSLPKEYTTTVKLAPETEEVSKRMNSLGGLAAMAGVNLGASSGADAISPDLYPDVVGSTPFLLELFPMKVNGSANCDSLSLYMYMRHYQRTAWWNYIIRAPFQILGAVRNLFSGPVKDTAETLDPFRLKVVEESVLRGLRSRIHASVDKKTFVVTVSVRMQDPVVSAEVTRTVMQRLQEYIIAYRTQKVKYDLEFTHKVFEDTRDAYYKAQHAYAAFEDANRNLISSSYRTEQERLKNEMTLAFNVYNSVAQKLEQDKLRVQEQTPVYTVIEPATVPIRASSPKKMLILAGFVFLGLLGGMGYILMKDIFIKRDKTSF